MSVVDGSLLYYINASNRQLIRVQSQKRILHFIVQRTAAHGHQGIINTIIASLARENNGLSRRSHRAPPSTTAIKVNFSPKRVLVAVAGIKTTEVDFLEFKRTRVSTPGVHYYADLCDPPR